MYRSKRADAPASQSSRGATMYLPDRDDVPPRRNRHWNPGIAKIRWERVLIRPFQLRMSSRSPMSFKSKFPYTSPTSGLTPEIPCLQRRGAQGKARSWFNSPGRICSWAEATGAGGCPRCTPVLPAGRRGQPHRRNRQAPTQGLTAFAAHLVNRIAWARSRLMPKPSGTLNGRVSRSPPEP